MYKFISLVIFSFFFLPNNSLLACCNTQLSDNTILEVGDTAPEIKLKARRGGKKSLSKYKGKIVLVQFWASWCLPCRQFSKDWIRVYNKYKNATFKNGNGFEVYSISLDKSKKDWKRASKKDGIPWKANTIDNKGWDSNYAFIYGVDRLPLDFLLDENGKVLHIDFTANVLDEILEDMLQ